MDIENIIIKEIENEIAASEQNQDVSDTDFESYLGLISGERDEKTYEWQSDIRIPVFMAHFLTQASIDVGQYFQTRDFVEVKINDESDAAKNSADAAKEGINRTLNQRHLHHYLKFVRSKGITNLSGRVWLKCWWEQEWETQRTGTQLKPTQLDVDVNGNPLEYDWQEPAIQYTEEDVFEEVAVKDRFNYDVWDQRNVFCSNEYAYSAQDKEWIIFRSEATKQALEDQAEQNEYFNLDKLGEVPETTETKQNTTEKHESKVTADSSAQKEYDIYERYGKAWMILKGDKAEYGIDENGVKEGAVYEEAIITVAQDKAKKVLIGFKPTHFVDAEGNPYKPAIRGLCYVHPVDDDGMGDGQNVREIQTAIDDTFNISQDRVQLATLPSLKGRKSSIEDNTTIRVEPMGMMELDNPDDVQEFKITDNITGALNQLAYLEDKGRQVDSITEVSTGGVPSIASTTATAVSAASQNTNNRVNYKSLTFEYTALTELYWMIQQMTYAFAQEKTALKLFGEKVYDFDPTLECTYSPLSQSIETEASKMMKRKEWMQILQIASQMQHPSAPKMANYAFGEYVKLTGDEFDNARRNMLDESVPIQGGQDTPQQGGIPTSNEYGQLQTDDQMMAREAAYA